LLTLHLEPEQDKENAAEETAQKKPKKREREVREIEIMNLFCIHNNYFKALMAQRDEENVH